MMLSDVFWTLGCVWNCKNRTSDINSAFGISRNDYMNIGKLIFQQFLTIINQIKASRPVHRVTSQGRVFLFKRPFFQAGRLGVALPLAARHFEKTQFRSKLS